MEIVEMTFECMETCRNGKERVVKKKVYASSMCRWDEAKKMLEDRHYYRVLMLSAEWKDVLFVKEEK